MICPHCGEPFLDIRELFAHITPCREAVERMVSRVVLLTPIEAMALLAIEERARQSPDYQTYYGGGE